MPHTGLVRKVNTEHFVEELFVQSQMNTKELSSQIVVGVEHDSRFELECDSPFTDLCQDILVLEKLGKVLIMGDFNVRVGKYQNMELAEENIVDPCLLCDGSCHNTILKVGYQHI